mmetsp:Transcript_8488/g.30530  ORF Transcript_8488/g.30530 Transcript_8488/m.30530 type:complete len:227 (-) Transcript_8488:192-872(-)
MSNLRFCSADIAGSSMPASCAKSTKKAAVIALRYGFPASLRRWRSWLKARCAIDAMGPERSSYATSSAPPSEGARRGGHMSRRCKEATMERRTASSMTMLWARSSSSISAASPARNLRAKARTSLAARAFAENIGPASPNISGSVGRSFGRIPGTQTYLGTQIYSGSCSSACSRSFSSSSLYSSSGTQLSACDSHSSSSSVLQKGPAPSGNPSKEEPRKRQPLSSA